jgi:hypothetical protein
MRLESHHSIHQIHSGHQMRAVKGIVVQKKTKDSVIKYASVLRCEDLHPLSTFKYYNKEYMWQDFVEDKKD